MGLSQDPAVNADARWPADSPGGHLAAAVRSELLTVLGAPAAAAVLRGLARDGRLYPGLSPRLDATQIVGTETGPAFTSKQELVRCVKQGGGTREENEKRRVTLVGAGRG